MIQSNPFRLTMYHKLTIGIYLFGISWAGCSPVPPDGYRLKDLTQHHPPSIRSVGKNDSLQTISLTAFQEQIKKTSPHGLGSLTSVKWIIWDATHKDILLSGYTNDTYPYGPPIRLDRFASALRIPSTVQTVAISLNPADLSSPSGPQNVLVKPSRWRTIASPFWEPLIKADYFAKFLIQGHHKVPFFKSQDERAKKLVKDCDHLLLRDSHSRIYFFPGDTVVKSWKIKAGTIVSKYKNEAAINSFATIQDIVTSRKIKDGNIVFIESQEIEILSERLNGAEDELLADIVAEFTANFTELRGIYTVFEELYQAYNIWLISRILLKFGFDFHYLQHEYPLPSHALPLKLPGLKKEIGRRACWNIIKYQSIVVGWVGRGGAILSYGLNKFAPDLEIDGDNPISRKSQTLQPPQFGKYTSSENPEERLILQANERFHLYQDATQYRGSFNVIGDMLVLRFDNGWLATGQVTENTLTDFDGVTWKR